MSSFNPLIPTGLVPLDEDYKNLQLNFQQLDTSFGIDHTKFSVNTLNGYHTVVHLVPFSTVASNGPNNQPVMAPPAVAGLGEIFTAQINDGIATDEAFYYRSGGGRLTQFTRNFTPTNAANGATFLPGGLILNWGTITPVVNRTLTPVTFLQPYTNSCFSVVLTPARTGTPTAVDQIYVNATTNTTFSYFSTVSSSGGFASFSWISIGY